jgi:hypothetical protein
MMSGSEFVQEFAKKGYAAWEAAALELARRDGLTPWPWTDLVLTDGVGNTATLKVQSDVLSIGPTQDYVRLPLTPTAAQNILNLYGWLLPTPWLDYQIFKQAGVKLQPRAMVPNRGANLQQYAEHSAIIDQQLKNTDRTGPGPVAGIKKHVVVSNIAQPGKVLIHGWYKPPPWPDVYDDGKPWQDPNKQPQQAKSNAHGDFYVDYSHGIQAIGPTAVVNAPGIFQGEMSTVDLYQHPVLSKLVSNEGPVRTPRYPAQVLPAKNRPSHELAFGRPAVDVVPTIPSLADQGVAAFSRRSS